MIDEPKAFEPVTEPLCDTDEARRAERLELLAGLAERLAHDLRNPLNSILLNLSMLSDVLRTGQGETADADQMLGAIRSGALRIQGAVDRFVRLTHPPAPELLPRSLDDSVRGAEPQLRRRAEAAGVTLRLEHGAADAQVALDVERFHEALSALVDNAIHASPRGATVLVLTDRDDREARCSVVDLGSGMSRETIAHMFVPFFTTRERAAGLGLTMVDRFAMEHGASVRFRSDPGAGTMVVLAFPVRRDEPALDEENEQ